MADVGVRRMINGPEAFTPDNEFCLGETEVAGLFVAAGFCAHGIAGAGGIGKVMAEWIVEGEPSLDVWHMDINRFGRAVPLARRYTLARTVETYRTYYDIPFPGLQRESARGAAPLARLRLAPRARRGVRREGRLGARRLLRVERGRAATSRCARAAGWGGTGRRRSAPSICGTRERGRPVRRVVVRQDRGERARCGAASSTGSATTDVARAVGDVTYTQALNPRGGIECDFTVTRLGDDVFLIVTGTAFGTHDMAWLRKQARRRGAEVRIADVTGAYCCFALWGPRARDILSRLTPTDLSNAAFPFMTAQELTVGDVPARALRVTFVGELGWEIYASTASTARRCGRRSWAAGADDGLVAAGYRAIDSMRVEKGYRVWGSDLTAETTPYEAGWGSA